MNSIFRTLVVLSAILNILLWCLPYFDYMWLSNDELSLLDLSGLDAIINTSEAFYWVTLVVWLSLAVGLFFYIQISRTLFILYASLSACMTLFYGIQVFTPIESLISYLLTLSDGGIIAIMYLTSINDKFEAS